MRTSQRMMSDSSTRRTRVPWGGSVVHSVSSLRMRLWLEAMVEDGSSGGSWRKPCGEKKDGIYTSSGDGCLHFFFVFCRYGGADNKKVAAGYSRPVLA
jgi:hypothetical protein